MSREQINAKDEDAVKEYNERFRQHQSGLNKLKCIKVKGLPLRISLDSKIATKNLCTVGEYVLDSEEVKQNNAGKIGITKRISHAHIDQRANDSVMTLYTAQTSITNG